MPTSHAGHHHTGSTVARGWPAVVRRWPTLLAVAATVVLAGDRDEGAVGGLAAVLALLPAFYAVMLAVGHRRWTWPLVLVGSVGVVALRVAEVVDLPMTLILVGVVGLGAALLHGRAPREVVVQGAGLADRAGDRGAHRRGAPSPRARGRPAPPPLRRNGPQPPLQCRGQAGRARGREQAWRVAHEQGWVS